jgi:hypothetical protein
MKDAARKPLVHLFVCINERPATDPLGPGCGPRGVSVYHAAKSAIAAKAAYGTHWVSRTYCLGQCPRVGAAVCVYPEGRVIVEAEASDAANLLKLGK